MENIISSVVCCISFIKNLLFRVPGHDFYNWNWESQTEISNDWNGCCLQPDNTNLPWRSINQWQNSKDQLACPHFLPYSRTLTKDPFLISVNETSLCIVVTLHIHKFNAKGIKRKTPKTQKIKQNRKRKRQNVLLCAYGIRVLPLFILLSASWILEDSFKARSLKELPKSLKYLL